MKEKISKYLNNKKIVLLGFAKSNLVVANLLLEFEIPFTICDKSTNIDCNFFKKCDGKNIMLHLGFDYMNYINADIIFRSPAVPFLSKKLIEMSSNGIEIVSEIELFFKFCIGNTIGITGSDGKTTTSTIIYEIFKDLGLKTFLGGNIGNPLLTYIDDIKREDVVIVELSSFQLISMKQSPDISIITNISPNHLDIHKNMNEYVFAKKNIFKYQNENSFFITDYKNNFNFYNEIKSKIIFFESNKKIEEKFDNFLYIDENDFIVFLFLNKKIEIINRKYIKLRGEHNLKNFMAAICTVLSFFIKKLNFTNNLEKIRESIEKVAKNFNGVEHRIEFVKNINGINFYNDSIASTPTRTIEGVIKTFDNIILICGGYDKNISYDVLSKKICEKPRKVKFLILIGQTAEKIKESIEKNDEYPKIFNAKNMEYAVNIAYKLAKKNDNIILSPASASFDMYKNYKEKGKHFKHIVNNLG